MGKYKDRKLSDIVDYFPGSVRTYNCSPTMKCSDCRGDGKCTHCRGEGKTKCSKCHGYAYVNCSFCNGGGVCSSCKGKRGSYINGKWSDCLACGGGGHCSVCSGSGKKECSCDSGYEDCCYCSGTGKCRTCDGYGELECSRCMGTGYYQTYTRYTASIMERQYCHPGFAPELLDGLRLAEGDVVYKTTAAAWKRAGKKDFDKTDEKLAELCKASPAQSELTGKFCEELKSTPEMNESIDGFHPYKNQLVSHNVKCTKVRFSINGKQYQVVFIGNNNVVAYSGVPADVNLFQMSDIQKAEMKRTRYRRHQDMALLTAYIYNLIGKDPAESEKLSLIFKHMCLGDLVRDRKIRYYREKYTSSMPADVVLNKVRYLLKSNKVVSYVWQCVAIDNQLVAEGNEFFKEVVLWCGINKDDVKSLKRFAEKFAAIDKATIIDEYLESPVVFRDRHYIFWNIVFVTLFLAIVGSIIVLCNDDISYSTSDNATFVLVASIITLAISVFKKNPFKKYDQKKLNKAFEIIIDNANLTEAYYVEQNLPLRIYNGFIKCSISVIAAISRWYDILWYRTFGSFYKK